MRRGRGRACTDFHDWAKTPPMGWTSWDNFATTITERQTQEQADYMAANLKQFGWQYIVVDIQWYEPSAVSHSYRSDAVLTMDDHARLMPAVNRFPRPLGAQGSRRATQRRRASGELAWGATAEARAALDPTREVGVARSRCRKALSLSDETRSLDRELLGADAGGHIASGMARLETNMKRPVPDKVPLPVHDYGLAVQSAVSWLGDRYVLAEPQQRRGAVRPVYILEPRKRRGAVKLPAATRH